MQKAKPIIYIDPFGKEHDALVTAVNGLNEGYISVVYVDEKASDADNLKKVFDIPHFSDPSKQEVSTVQSNQGPEHPAYQSSVEQGNPGLPSYQLNCWKEAGEEHRALPSDHPAFDHPFQPKEFVRDADGNIQTDADGNQVIKPKSRPEYEADVAAHQALSQADGHADVTAQLDADGNQADESKPEPPADHDDSQ